MKTTAKNPIVTVKKPLKGVSAGYVRWRRLENVLIIDSIPPGRYEVTLSDVHPLDNILLTLVLDARGSLSSKHSYVMMRHQFEKAFPRVKLTSHASSSPQWRDT